VRDFTAALRCATGGALSRARGHPKVPKPDNL
jgi:hypothetical protein